MTPSFARKTVFIAAVSSDIGIGLAQLYLAQGCRVIGTYRNPQTLDVLMDHPDVTLIKCDLSQADGIDHVAQMMRENNLQWDSFISAVGVLDPIGSFFECDIEGWKNSVEVNSLQQLHLLHALYPFKRDRGYAAFLVGGAINRAFPYYSAYSLGKVMLVKFCELIATEYKDIHAVAIGTGWVATKIHEQTLKAGDRAGVNLDNTKHFIDSGKTGTTMQEIFDVIEWCFDHPETNGRNFSVVHDDWREVDGDLPSLLRNDPDMFLLRRHGNQSKAIQKNVGAG